MFTVRQFTFMTVISISTLLMVSGCSKDKNNYNIAYSRTVQDVAIADYNKSIAIESVSGGSPKITESFDKLTNLQLRRAIEDSLTSFGYFAGANSQATYQLRAEIIRLTLTNETLSLTAKAELSVNYTLTSNSNGAPVVQKFLVNTVDSVDASETLDKETRQRLAIAKVTRENLRKLLNGLGQK